jgi:hypothetical protein
MNNKFHPTNFKSSTFYLLVAFLLALPLNACGGVKPAQAAPTQQPAATIKALANLGVLYSRNQKWAETATEQGLVICSFYGMALVRLKRCDEALPIFQKLLEIAASDDVSAIESAKEGLLLCGASAGVMPQP